MTTAALERRSPLGLFPDKPVPRLYDRVVETLRVRHYSHRTEEAYARSADQHFAAIDRPRQRSF
jgi:hypothetical protein